MEDNCLDPDRRVYELHAEICKVLAHPVRLEVMDALRDGPKTPTELAEMMDLSKANLSQHLAVMRHRGLVHRTRAGNSVVYTVSDTRLFDACATLRSLLRDQLRAGGRLAQHGFSPPAGGHGASGELPADQHVGEGGQTSHA
jgi:DNA-binding transcriptional ArsR family regulator